MVEQGELPNDRGRFILSMPNVPMTNNSLEDRLRSEKPMRNAPAGLTERVMSRLPEQEADVRPSSARFSFWPRLALGIATVAIVLVIAGEFWRHSGTTTIVSTPPATTSTKPVELASTEPMEIPIPTITTEQVQALTAKIDQPLEKELKNVISDTRLAIQFVASNFLPEQ